MPLCSRFEQRPRARQGRRQRPELGAGSTGRFGADKRDALDGITGPPGPYGETVTIDAKGITVRYPDDAAKLRIGGRLQLDFGAVGVGQRDFSRAFEDDFTIRRSWIESYLTLSKEIELAFQYDFADATRPINDAIIAYQPAHAAPQLRHPSAGAEVDIRVIQVLLGHAKLNTTALYARVVTETIRAVTSPIEALTLLMEGRSPRG